MMSCMFIFFYSPMKLIDNNNFNENNYNNNNNNQMDLSKSS